MGGYRLVEKDRTMNSFRKLNVYIKSKQLVKDIYQLLKKFPKEEQYALCDQLRRSSVSVPSNIAEGMGRTTEKDQAHFLSLVYGSLTEVLAQLDIACDLEYITNEEFEKEELLLDEIARMLSGLAAKRSSNFSPKVTKGASSNLKI